MVLWWSKWAKQAAELQFLRADAENQRKDDDDFYKLNVENIVAIREELSDDFLSLAREQLATVRLWWNNWTTTSWIHNSSSGDMNKNGDDKRRPKELRRSISVTKSSLWSMRQMKPELGKPAEQNSRGAVKG
mgnify:CR=1 FL=1